MRLNDAYCADATRTDHVPAVRAWCETIQDTARNLIYTSALFSILLANSILLLPPKQIMLTGHTNINKIFTPVSDGSSAPAVNFYRSVTLTLSQRNSSRLRLNLRTKS